MANEYNFWKRALGKVMSYFVHEHTNGLGYIVNSIPLIESLIHRGCVTFDSEESKLLFMRQIEMIKDGKQRCKDASDFLYNRIKEFDSELFKLEEQ